MSFFIAFLYKKFNLFYHYIISLFFKNEIEHTKPIKPIETIKNSETVKKSIQDFDIKSIHKNMSIVSDFDMTFISNLSSLLSQKSLIEDSRNPEEDSRNPEEDSRNPEDSKDPEDPEDPDLYGFVMIQVD